MRLLYWSAEDRVSGLEAFDLKLYPFGFILSLIVAEELFQVENFAGFDHLKVVIKTSKCVKFVIDYAISMIPASSVHCWNFFSVLTCQLVRPYSACSQGRF